MSRMRCLQLAVISSLLVVQVRGDVTVSGLEDVSVKEGDEATLTCSASSQISVCVWTAPSGSQYSFSEGQTISKYEDGRIVYSSDNPQKECRMTITSVKDSDNGKWKCAITANVGGSGKTGYGSLNVTVLKAPASIYLEPNEQSLLLNYPKDSQTKVSCVADGSRPEPTFSWKIGDQKIHPHVVATDVSRRPDGSTVANQTIHYESRPEHNGKSLTCIVHSEGYSQDQLESGDNVQALLLNIQYQPTASKKEEQVFYGLNVGEHFEIQITFESNPGPDQILWKMYDNEEVPMGSDSPNGRYESSLVNPGPVGVDGTYTAVLKIKEVIPEDAETVNTLVVKNQLGETEIRFRLGMGEQPPADSEGFEVESLNTSEAAAGPIIAIVVIILVVIAVIAVAVIARSQGLFCFAVPPGKKEEDKEKAVDTEDGSDSESVEQVDHSGDDAEAGAHPSEPKQSITSRMTSLFSAVKKTVGSPRKTTANGHANDPAELQEGEEKGDEEKREEEEEGEMRREDITYANLDKRALADAARMPAEHERTEYTEIQA